MLNLINKEFVFTKKQALILVAYCILVPIALNGDSGANLYMASVFIPFVATSLMVNKICAIEDSVDMRILLKRLPYKGHIRVAARFSFAFIVLALSLLYLTCIQAFAFRQGEFLYLLKDNVLLFLLFATYYGLYLTLYYWKGCHFAQYSTYFCFIGYFGVSLLMNRFGKGEAIQKLIQSIAANFMILVIVCLGIIFLLFLLASFCEKNRELI